MKTVSVTVLKPLEWKGRQYVPGELVDVTPIDAVVLSHKHHVTLTRRKAIREAVESVPAPPVVEKKKGGRYRRKDLQASELPHTVLDEPIE